MTAMPRFLDSSWHFPKGGHVLSLVMNQEIETTKVLGADTGFVQQSFGVQVQVLSISPE